MPEVEIKGTHERRRIFEPEFCGHYGTQRFAHHSEARCIIAEGPLRGRWKTQSMLINLDAPNTVKKKLRGRASRMKHEMKKEGYY
jgi:hypothetical protein